MVENVLTDKLQKFKKKKKFQKNSTDKWYLDHIFAKEIERNFYQYHGASKRVVLCQYYW